MFWHHQHKVIEKSVEFYVIVYAIFAAYILGILLILWGYWRYDRRNIPEDNWTVRFTQDEVTGAQQLGEISEEPIICSDME